MLDRFLYYLTVEKGLSDNTIEAYRHDLNRFLNHLREKGMDDLSKVGKVNLQAFLVGLKHHGLSARTIARNQVALRSFFRFLVLEGILKTNPAQDLESPKRLRICLIY